MTHQTAGICLADEQVYCKADLMSYVFHTKPNNKKDNVQVDQSADPFKSYRLHNSFKCILKKCHLQCSTLGSKLLSSYCMVELNNKTIC